MFRCQIDDETGGCRRRRSMRRQWPRPSGRHHPRLRRVSRDVSWGRPADLLPHPIDGFVLRSGTCYGPRVVSSNTKVLLAALVGSTVAVIAVVILFVGLRSDVAEVRTDLRRLDDRLRAVEIEFGKVDQRLATLERLRLPAPDPAE